MITELDSKNYSYFVDFNRSVYPHRRQIENSLKYRMSQNPYADDEFDNVILTKEDDIIIGQAIKMPSVFIYKNIVQASYWTMDYFVDPESRNSLAGLSIALEAVKLKNHFAIGLTPESLAIHTALKEKMIGYMYKFYRIENYFKAFFQYFSIKKKKQINAGAAPDEIKVKDSVFLRVTDPKDIVSGEGFYNKDILEFTREEKFLRWRFFHHHDKYLVYRIKNGDNETLLTNYFVVRPMIWKKMRALLLVDYRFPVTDPEIFSLILSALKKLSGSINASVTVTGCTLPGLFPVLNMAGFRSFGNKMSIVTNFKNIFNANNNEQDELFITYADSDCDFNYGDNCAWEYLYE